MIDTGKNGEFRYEQSDIVDQDGAEFGITPSQTVGPYVHIGLTLDNSEHLVEPGTEGAVNFTVSITDGNGDPIADAMFELWQANPEGVHNSDLDPNREEPATADGFRGLGRAMANANGEATFTTLVPGAFDDEAPHFKVGVFARGILERLYTRAYLPDVDLSTDPVLAVVPEERRELLVATKTDGGFRFDIKVQSDTDETPFFGL
ncbi:protocatechuate 3,4-dioxygenase subunit beta [Corynebacterium deserti GIMN1.010]|uniref:Protocatechuate 3,4-dioxygenase subunit beta n=1 Tax=Corynebacterium deserti GIMN1.010 TaxID=931089 RepID=A0A0M5IUL1_9CORY|nr:protocatechuate 3,4-dioxygenase subunit alpha [Corynebacterium deserti]ALC06556.1 protocatechuate 3,4-dioxygenase subunit beta [Corynebacterium deserti GIMN1.010]